MITLLILALSSKPEAAVAASGAAGGSAAPSGRPPQVATAAPLDPSEGLCDKSETPCAWANDGVCDDGGHGSLWWSCEYGEDCDDCGVRPYHSPSPPPSPKTTVSDEANLCTDDEDRCIFLNDGTCDDGGPGSKWSDCPYAARAKRALARRALCRVGFLPLSSL